MICVPVHSCFLLPDRYPDFPPLVVQDLETTREVANAYIASQNLSHRVAFEAHDFFQPQPPIRTGETAYLIQRGKYLSRFLYELSNTTCSVLHDWDINTNAKILGHLTEKLRSGVSVAHDVFGIHNEALTISMFSRAPFS